MSRSLPELTVFYGAVREVFCAAIGRGLLERNIPLQFQCGTSLS